jgi:hypothetical protein
MLQVYVPNVLSAPDVYCIQVFYVLKICLESQPGRRGMEHGEPEAGGWGVLGSCDPRVLVLIPAPESVHAEREEGSGRRSGGHSIRGRA